MQKGKRNSYTLLIGIYVSATAMESSMKVPQKK
jgi:hypothetical protein